MDEQAWLAAQFEDNRGHLHAVAYRMLGSLTDADDAVQEAWLRLSRANAGDVKNLCGWLTAVVARVSLDVLRARRARREEPMDAQMPDPIVSLDAGVDPEHEAILADSVGLALLVTLETLDPAERVAFVPHDVFAVPFAEIGAIVVRSPAAARQLASRARRRVKGAAVPDADLARQRDVVDAFLAAARDDDFDALVAVLDPDVVVRADRGPEHRGAPSETRGAHKAASQALKFSRMAQSVQRVLVNGAAGIVSWRPDGRPFSLMAFTVAGGKIVEIDVLLDPARLERLNLRPAPGAPSATAGPDQ